MKGIPEIRFKSLLPDHLRHDFMVQMDNKSIDRIQIISWLAFIMYSSLFFLDYRRFQDGLFQENPVYKTLFYLHLSGLAYLIPALATTLAKDKVKATRLSRGVIFWLTFAFMTGNLLGQSYYSYHEYQSLSLYMIYVLVTNWTFTMNHPQRMFFNLGSFLLLIVGINIGEAAGNVRGLVSIYEGFFFTIIAFLFGTFDYNLRAAKYLEEQELKTRTAELNAEKKKSDALLLNILPEAAAEELKRYGKTTPQRFELVTVMFTDFLDFTRISSEMNPTTLVDELGTYFAEFDRIADKHGLEKIKTIGDSYMCAGGMSERDADHVIHMIGAALEIRDYMIRVMHEKDLMGIPHFAIRIGIHTGPVVAGVVGLKKFAYDIWGDTVNTASRMELHCEPWKINISQDTLSYLGEHVEYSHRGKIEVKSKGQIDMYYVISIRS